MQKELENKSFLTIPNPSIQVALGSSIWLEMLDLHLTLCDQSKIKGNGVWSGSEGNYCFFLGWVGVQEKKFEHFLEEVIFKVGLNE